MNIYRNKVHEQRQPIFVFRRYYRGLNYIQNFKYIIMYIKLNRDSPYRCRTQIISADQTITINLQAMISCDNYPA